MLDRTLRRLQLSRKNAALQEELARDRRGHGAEHEGERASLHRQLAVPWRMRSVSEVRAQGKRTTDTHLRKVRT